MTARGLMVARMVLVATVAASGPAAAVEWSVSGFGTVGVARSDQAFNYQRYVNDNGSFKRDSVGGLQLDAKLSREFSATLQAKLAAPEHRDDGVRASVAWGFLAWRPNNEWLLRAGKFRVPLYLHSQTKDVGLTFDSATLPVEVYSQSPTNDFTGLSAIRSWNTAHGEFVLDAYWGRASTHIRNSGRHDLTAIVGPVAPPSPAYLAVRVEARGLTLTSRHDDDLFRVAYLRARLESRSRVLFAERYPFVEIAGLPGVGYYDTLEGIATSRTPLLRHIEVPVIMLGADIAGPFGTRVAAEYGRRIVKQALGFDSKGAYVSMRKRWGAWTPYVTLAMLRSTDGDRAEFAAVNAQRVPDFIEQSALLNLLQESGADGIQIFDQTSLAAGFSYRLSRTSMLKAEWQHVRIGQTSALADPPRNNSVAVYLAQRRFEPGALIQHQRMNVFSLSYSVVF